MTEKVRAYVTLPGDTQEVVNPACLLVNGIPIITWCILYLREEGVEDIVVVGGNSQARYISQGSGVRILRNSELRGEDITGLDFILYLSSAYPFHRPGEVFRLITLAKGVSRVATSNLEFEVVNLHPVPDTPYLRKVKYEYPYNLGATNRRNLASVHHLASRAENLPVLLPNEVKKIAVIQNTHIHSHNFSPFIESCDLIARVNLCDAYITGLYGSRTDLLMLGDWERLTRQQSWRRELPQIFYHTPLIYTTHAQVVKSGEMKYAYDYSRIARSSEHGWTTTALFIDLLLTAFPEATVYTTSVKTIQEFNAGTHMSYGDEMNTWKTWDWEGKVIDILTPENAGVYGEEGVTPEGISFLTFTARDSGVDVTILMNSFYHLFKMENTQQFGRIEREDEEEIVLTWFGIKEDMTTILKKGERGWKEI